MFTRKPAKRVSLESFKAGAGDVSVKPSTDIPFPTRNMIGAAAAAVAALSVAFGTPALAADTGSPVTIVDPKTSANGAHVTSDGELEITGGVTTQQANPAKFFHQTTLGGFSAGACAPIATPPAGSALIIKQVRINVTAQGQPGATQAALIFVGNSAEGTCAANSQFGQINSPTVGQYVVPFDPGLGIPTGSVLGAKCIGALQCIGREIQLPGGREYGSAEHALLGSRDRYQHGAG
jgi:hypothetical protein